MKFRGAVRRSARSLYLGTAKTKPVAQLRSDRRGAAPPLAPNAKPNRLVPLKAYTTAGLISTGERKQSNGPARNINQAKKSLLLPGGRAGGQAGTDACADGVRRSVRLSARDACRGGGVRVPHGSK